MRRTNTDYTKFSEPEEVKTDVTETTEPLESVAAVDPDKGPEGEKPLDTPVTAAVVEGKVINCKMVNVRVSANGDCPIASVIPEEEVVKVFPGKSTSDYYAVKTDHEIEGFIKKEFIELI